jgi:glucokinase
LTQTPNPLYIGIDIGGTKILAIVATAEGAIVGRAIHDTDAARPVDAIIASIGDASRDAVADANVDPSRIVAAGIAAAGAIDTRSGTLIWAPQMQTMANTPIVSLFRQHWDVPTAVANDANLAALAEQRYGAAWGNANVLFITVSTGIGGGIVLNGEVYAGAGGFAGEVGHMTLDAHGPLGRSTTPGAWESLCSGIALARITTERVMAGETSSLESVARNGEIDARHIFDALRANDPLAIAVVGDAIEYMGVALAGVVNVLNPGIIVIGGGLSKEWETYISPSVAIMREISFAGAGAHTPVVPPALGIDAGALGAIALATTLA